MALPSNAVSPAAASAMMPVSPVFGEDVPVFLIVVVVCVAMVLVVVAAVVSAVVVSGVSASSATNGMQ